MPPALRIAWALTALLFTALVVLLLLSLGAPEDRPPVPRRRRHHARILTGLLVVLLTAALVAWLRLGEALLPAFRAALLAAVVGIAGVPVVAATALVRTGWPEYRPSGNLLLGVFVLLLAAGISVFAML